MATSSWMTAVVTDRWMTTPRVAVLELQPADGGEFPDHEAGAHIDVKLEDPASGATFVRQYSLCGRPGDRKRYRIGVLLDERSRGGSVAAHQLMVDHVVPISPPRNAFPLVDARRYVLFAGGIGITPLLAMSQELDAAGADYALHYCSRSAQDVAFRDHLRDHPRVALHLDDGAAGQKLDLGRDLGPPEEGVVVFVCGPGPFMDHVLDTAEAMGWPGSALHKERFAPSAVVEGKDDGSFVVRLASSGASYDVSPAESILDVLVRNGVDAPSSCQQGICGECVVRVRSGEPDHRDDVLTDAEHAEGLFTTCVSRAAGDVLELDL